MVKLRAAEQGKHAFRRVTGGQTWVFGIDLAAGEYRKIHVTEGELDAMALHQMGIRPAVAITAGAKTPPSQEVRELLTMFDEVVFVFDNDDAGRDGVRIHADVIGPYRCSTATLQRKDAAACLQDQVSVIDVQAAVMSATAIGGDVVHVSKGLRLLRDPKTRKQGIATGWPKLNQMTAGGFQVRELVIVMGLTGVGKTTWTTNLAMNMSLSGTGLYFMPLEGGKEAEQSKIIRMIGQKRVMDLTDQEFIGTESVIAGMPMWMCEHRGKMPIGSVRANIELAVRRHGVKVVVVDHLDFCCEDATDTREQDRVITELNQIGLDFDVVMIVVVHTKKPPEIVKQKGKEREEPPPTLYEVKGSSAIVQLASYVLRVHRERRDPSRIGQSAISIMKKRPDDAREGDIAQWFDEVTLVFSDTKPILISPGGQQP